MSLFQSPYDNSGSANFRDLSDAAIEHLKHEIFDILFTYHSVEYNDRMADVIASLTASLSFRGWILIYVVVLLTK